MTDDIAQRIVDRLTSQGKLKVEPKVESLGQRTLRPKEQRMYDRLVKTNPKRAQELWDCCARTAEEWSRGEAEARMRKPKVRFEIRKLRRLKD